ncbi:MAG TPA: acetyl-CoA carboxylase biotin carboxyl carrier protein [Terracidiphilus sp.]|jgi:acetyl-CoA carboxylase biotin carboxyl carrier protein|nr:acetyl-CoA carboxylase biotin carboxyl carrier protein [Terracidiphilus sp.]
MKPEDMDDLKELVEFLKSNQVAEFDLDRGDVKIRLKFSQPAAPAVIHGIQHAVAGFPAAMPLGPATYADAEPAEPAFDPDAGLHMIKSPIVGTYYGSPSPGAAAFVAPGDHVEKGQVVGIVEAMKLMNEIESDAAGEIVRCLVTNGQPIEFGQPLFAVRTA